MGVDLHDPVVRAAIRTSHLAAVPEPLLEPLFADATRLSVPAGSMVRREGERGPHIELVVGGLVRVYVSSPDGRTLTVRYCRSGAMIGAVSLFRPSYVMPGGLQALVDTDLLVLRAQAVRLASDRDRAMADALIAELSDRVYQFVVEIPGASIRDRPPAGRPPRARHRRRATARGPAGGSRSASRRSPTPWAASARSWRARSASCGGRSSWRRVRAASRSSIRTGSPPTCSRRR